MSTYFSEKFLCEFHKFCQRDPNFSTRRESDRDREEEKERDSEGRVDLDRHDVALRNFANAPRM